MRNTITLLLSASTLLVALSACHDDPAQPAGNASTQEQPLPQPELSGHAVTGMPAQPGPGDVPLAGDPPPPPMLDADTFGMPVLPHNPEAGIESIAQEDAQPGPDEALQVLRAYFQALNAGDPARAHALWSQQGRANGASSEQFKQQWANLEIVTTQIGTPGQIEGAAGSRFIQIPVGIAETHVDGSIRRYSGVFTLQYSVSEDSESETEPRSWRIASTQLNPVGN